MATAKTVAAGTSLRQADIIEAANLGRKQCIELMEVAQVKIIYLKKSNLLKIFTEVYLETHSEPSQVFKMELFAKIVNGFQPLAIFAKSFILDT